MNKGVFFGLLGIALVAAVGFWITRTGEPGWRSSLYPEDWQPGFADASGRFLHDFSYAGYARGEKPIPDKKGPVFDVTHAPYTKSY